MVFDEQEKEAQRRYDNFDREQLKRAGEVDQVVADDGLKDPSVTPGGSSTRSPQLKRLMRMITKESMRRMETIPAGWKNNSKSWTGDGQELSVRLY